jgi:hypothetical protein
MDGFQNRKSGKDGLDDFPTPKWATRAFIAHCLPESHRGVHEDLTAWEPCANRGHMVEPLRAYFDIVIGSDVNDYGYGFPVIDFLDGPTPMDHGMEVDWIVTNPPFNKAIEFFERWYNDMPSVRYLAMFLRANFTEGAKRYDRVFSVLNPKLFCPYVERVPLVAGRLDKDVSTQMPYAWFVWDREFLRSPTRVRWIPPSRKEYDREEDWPTYDENGNEVPF